MFGYVEPRGPRVGAALVDGLLFRFPGTRRIPVRGLLLVVGYMIVMAFVVPSLRLWPMSTVWISFVLGLLLRMRHAWLVQRRVGRPTRHGLAASIGAALLVFGVFGLFAAISWHLGPSVEASLVYQLILALDDPERRPILAPS